MEPKSHSKSISKLLNTGFNHNYRLRNFIIYSVLIIFILGLVGGYLVLKEHIFISGETHTYFTVVLDCGSTGSRVNVYEWMTTSNGTKVEGSFPVLLRSYPDNMNKSSGCEYHCMQTEPGLHNFVNDRFGVKASLQPLIRYAEQWVPLERRGITPIFVLATAGMRRLTVENSEMILSEVMNVVKEHSFLYKKSWIRVLTGKEEAYYGWVALNYKMGVFGSSLRSSTLGLLDLGGSSLQVVAEADGSMKDEHTIRSKIGIVEHDIVAYSLPAFGLNEAFERTVIMLSHSQALRESGVGKFEVRHPCLSYGFVQNYTCRGCFSLDTSDSRNLRNQVHEYDLNSLYLVGEPNWEQCKLIARAAAINSSSTDWSNRVLNANCLGFSSYGGNAEINLTKSSSTVTSYHALSGFFAVHNALNLSHKANLTMLWETGQKLCSNLRSHHSSIDGQNCFRVPYLTSLIENALCLGDMHIIFGPGDVSWTLGASLIEGDHFTSLDAKKSQLTLKSHEIISSPLVTFLVLLFLLLIVYCCQIKLPMPSRKVTATRTLLPSYLCPKRQPN